MREEKTVSFTDVEWRLMQTLWTLGTPTFGEIMKAVQDSGWIKQSVLSFLRRLEAKSAVARDTSCRPNRYMALVKKEDAVRAETDAVIEKVHGGNSMLMVTSAVNSGKLNEQEIQSLIDLLRKGSVGGP